MACHEQAKRVEWAVLDFNQWLLPPACNATCPQRYTQCCGRVRSIAGRYDVKLMISHMTLILLLYFGVGQG